MTPSYVVVVFGASGSGKSTLLQLLQQAGNQYSIHIKGTDRVARQYDGIEIRCVADLSTSEYDYIYQTYGHKYGIQRSQIDDALASARHHFIICNDPDVIRALKRDYGSSVRTILHTFDAPREALQSIQLERAIADDEINLRLAKTTALYRAYLENRELFDAVLPNHYGEPISALKSRLERVLLEFSTEDAWKVTAPLLERLSLFTQRLELLTTAHPTTTTVDPGYVYIIMAIREEDPAGEDVHQGIKRACLDLSLRAERVDEIQFTGQITEKILSSIRLAEFVVADLTYEQPNVYYEVGYADALGKPLVLLAAHGATIHFDLQGHKVLYYRNATELQTKLQSAILALRGRNG